MEIEEFIERVAPAVIKSCNFWGLIPSIAIAQLCLESTYGNSELAINAKNIAGKKWNQWRFQPYYKVTNEYLQCTLEQAIANGWTPVNPEKRLYSKPLPFNLYTSWDECIDHYCENIMTSKWYERARSFLPDYFGFLNAMTAVYAPNHLTYADDVMRIVYQYNLTQYDSGLQ